jgi:hypothetical protein
MGIKQSTSQGIWIIGRFRNWKELATGKLWMEQYNNLKKYKEENGHNHIRCLNKEHRSLGE